MVTPSLPEEVLQEAVEALALHGSQTKAAAALGIARDTFQNRLKRAAQRGLCGTGPVLPGFSLSKTTAVYNQDGDIVREFVQQKPEPGEQYQPIDGMALKGRTTWTDGHGRVTQQVHMERADVRAQLEFMRATMEALKEELPRLAPTPAPPLANADLLNQFTVTDSHFGMLAWAEETGADYDLEIAERLWLDWFAAAVQASPPAHTAIFAQLGDLVHYDSMTSETPKHRHVLDSDSRFPKIVRVVTRAVRQAIRMLLERHQEVRVIMAPGNHDPASAVWLREGLAAQYENEPRLKVNVSPKPYFAEEWGRTALFYHHGDKRGVANIDATLAGEFRELYGRSLYAYAHIGHLHSDEGRKTGLMYVERHETLAAKDAHAAWGGWPSGRSAKVITYSKTGGEVFRSTLRPEMVAGAYAA